MNKKPNNIILQLKNKKYLNINQLKLIKSKKLQQKINKIQNILNINNARQILWHIEYNINNIPICPVCKKNKLTWHSDNRIYRKYCSNKCTGLGSIALAKKTSLQKYGVEHYSKTKHFQQQIKKTSLQKYGVEHYSKTKEFNIRVKKTNRKKFNVDYPAQSNIIQNKIKRTCLKKYNVGHHAKTKECQDKIKQTCLKKYNVDNYTKTKECQDKIKRTCLKKYGVSSPMQHLSIARKSSRIRKEKYYSKNILNKLSNPSYLKKEHEIHTLNFIAKKLKVSPSNLGKYYAKHNIPINHHTNNSDGENEIIQFLKENNIQIKKHCYNILKTKEIDIFLPEHNLAIEYNGIYWHTEHKGKNKNYHLNKTLECEKQGIQLLHIFDIEWNNPIKQDIWKSIILSKCKLNKKIYARKCILQHIDNTSAINFMEENHLLGFMGGNIKLGLFYKNQLMQCIILGDSRFNRNYKYEIIRMGSLKNHNIVGGTSKLIKQITEPIITYANRRYSTGIGYQKSNMQLSHTSSPNYYYTKNGRTLESRNKYQKHKLSKILKNFNPNFTESENMKNNGYHRIWDCGNLIFTTI